MKVNVEVPLEVFIEAIRGVSLGKGYLEGIHMYLPPEHHSGLENITKELEHIQEKLLSEGVLKGIVNAG
jgi:hypothetical protein